MRPEARVGTVFEEWRLEALLDAGPVAATYTAARFGERVSIRILHAHLATSKSVRERFLGLADVAGRIDHAGVVRVIAADTTRDGEAQHVTLRHHSPTRATNASAACGSSSKPGYAFTSSNPCPAPSEHGVAQRPRGSVASP